MALKNSPQLTLLLGSMLALASACSAADGPNQGLFGAAGGAGGNDHSGGAGGTGNTSSGDGSGGFNPTTTSGSSSGGNNAGNCNGALPATIRDFSWLAPTAHPDFQTFSNSVATTGLVESQLGSDNKPVYAMSGGQLTGPAEFAQWYNDTPGVNHTFSVTLTLTETSPGLFEYNNDEFFPIDNMGFGNEGNDNNFHFTTEIHTTFKYVGGETFKFKGDDDLWLFINKKLAIDLGGLHPELEQSIDLDSKASELGISPGNDYAMDIFHAERRTEGSHFRIETTIDCFQPPT